MNQSKYHYDPESSDKSGIGGVAVDGKVRRSQTDVVVHRVKRMIVEGALGPGDQLPVEKDLALQLGVSRGSLREGVSALSIMGVLETRQGAGTFVTRLDASLLLAPMSFMVDLQSGTGGEQLHSVRRVLEAEAASRAALLMTPEVLSEASVLLDRFESALSARVIDHEAILDWDIEFHRLIATSCGNHVLSALIDAFASRSVRGRLWRAIADDTAELATLAEHRAIWRALADRSPDGARVRMANHLLAVEDFLKDRPAADDAMPPAPASPASV
jgi:GntR family transcriptional regulator, transcriptional repressor for pyruvate dehydrogenase complex